MGKHGHDAVEFAIENAEAVFVAAYKCGNTVVRLSRSKMYANCIDVHHQNDITLIDIYTNSKLNIHYHFKDNVCIESEYVDVVEEDDYVVAYVLGMGKIKLNGEYEKRYFATTESGGRGYKPKPI